jgi:hypothetical protein
MPLIRKYLLTSGRSHNVQDYDCQQSSRKYRIASQPETRLPTGRDAARDEHPCGDRDD